MQPEALRRCRLPCWPPLAALLGVCGTIAPPPVAVYQSLGSRQGEGGGRTPAALAKALRAAGIPVRAVRCDSDGRMRPQVCGAPDGRLAVIDVPAEHQAAAEAMGFRPLATLADARRTPCPPGG